MWSKFLSFILAIFKSSIAKEALVFVGDQATLIAKAGGKLLIKSALDAVKAAEATGGSGKEKWEAAQATVKAELSAGGKVLVQQAIDAAIQAAVVKLFPPKV